MLSNYLKEAMNAYKAHYPALNTLSRIHIRLEYTLQFSTKHANINEYLTLFNNGYYRHGTSPISFGLQLNNDR